MAIIPYLERTDVKYTANICNHRIVLLYFSSRPRRAKTARLQRYQSVRSVLGLLQETLWYTNYF